MYHLLCIVMDGCSRTAFDRGVSSGYMWDRVRSVSYQVQVLDQWWHYPVTPSPVLSLFVIFWVLKRVGVA